MLPAIITIVGAALPPAHVTNCTLLLSPGTREPVAARRPIDEAASAPFAHRPSRGGAMFDYVIVGAGSAGCVLAARLSEDPDVRVAVIEAGPPDDEAVIHMPLAFRQLWESRFDWGLWSEREPELGERRDLLPRGRVLGGRAR
jgi:hypothetical protein